MKIVAVAILVGLMLGSCATLNQSVLDSGGETQLQKRVYQSRIFDTSDRKKVLRTVIATLQDLSFVVDQADLTLGLVSATKLDGSQIKITVSVRARGSDRLSVRANAQLDQSPIENPKQYQNFFTSLEKALFLTAHLEENAPTSN